MAVGCITALAEIAVDKGRERPRSRYYPKSFIVPYKLSWDYVIRLSWEVLCLLKDLCIRVG